MSREASRGDLSAYGVEPPPSCHVLGQVFEGLDMVSEAKSPGVARFGVQGILQLCLLISIIGQQISS